MSSEDFNQKLTDLLVQDEESLAYELMDNFPLHAKRFIENLEGENFRFQIASVSVIEFLKTVESINKKISMKLAMSEIMEDLPDAEITRKPTI